MSRLVALVVAVLIVALAGDALAHGSEAAYLDVTVIDDVEAVASLRSTSAAHLTLTSPDCTLETTPSAARSQSVTLLRLRCPRGVAGARLEITGLTETSGVVVARVLGERGDSLGAVLAARAPSLAIPTSGAGPSVFVRYVRLGVGHVTSGLDHVLFLLALVWQSHAASRGALRSWARELARAATAFTLAHMVTLTATSLGWLHVPSSVAEAMIAVSLVLVALDVGREGARPLKLGVVMAFGLVHGLGFADALAGARLPDSAVLLGLLGFNVGVELGQLLLLGGAVVVIALIPRLAKGGELAFCARAATLSAYVIGATGAYLVLARSTDLFLR